MQLYKNTLKYFDNDPGFVEKVLRHFYVDDLNSGVNSVDQGVYFYEKLKSILLKAHFNLRKWRTNSIELRKLIYEEEKQTKGIPIYDESFIEKEYDNSLLHNIVDKNNLYENHIDDNLKENSFDNELEGNKILGIKWEENKGNNY